MIKNSLFQYRNYLKLFIVSLFLLILIPTSILAANEDEGEVFTTDFSNDELEESPFAWTSIWGEGNWIVKDSPFRLEHTAKGSQRQGFTWDEVGEINDDVEVSAVVRADRGDKGLDTAIQLGIYMSGTVENENAYYLDMKGSDSNSPSQKNMVRINKYENGEFKTLQSSELPFTINNNSWYNVILKRDESSIKAKVWPFGEDEPETFQVTTTDTSLNSGRVGIGKPTNDTVNEWAFFSVATGKESALRAPNNMFLDDAVRTIKAEKLNESDYKEESWQVFVEALQEAEDVLTNDHATQEEIDEAHNKLNDARYWLVERSEFPTTGFEDRKGDSYTTHAEELLFLEEVAEQTDTMEYQQVATTLEGLPLHLVKLGYPNPSNDEEIINGRSILLLGSQHGNEPAGREMSLQLIRDLAFTENPELINQLKDTTILIIPSANPDGRENNIRSNGFVDLNRNHLLPEMPESIAVAEIMNTFEPDIVIDAHEGPSTPHNPGQINRIDLSYPKNLNVDEELRALNKQMVEDHILSTLESEGYKTGIYGSPGGAGGGDERILRNLVGLRHSLSILIESFDGTAETRVELQHKVVHGALKFHREHKESIRNVMEGSKNRAANSSESDSFYLGGADWEAPTEKEILNPSPKGYVINNNQASLLEEYTNLFSLQSEQVSENGVYFPMNQPMRTVIPLLLDERAKFNILDGIPIYGDTDPSSVELPPSNPLSPKAQYENDFSSYEIGERPSGWTSIWGDGNWVIKDNPFRIKHTANGNSRQGFTWDEVGEVRGDAEVSAVVRANRDGGNLDTVFQLGFNMSGTVENENAYYIDAKGPEAGSAPNTIRINRYQNGSFSTITRSELPFTVSKDTWYHVIIQRDDSFIKAKMWPFDEEEPEEFQVIAISSNSALDNGRIGIGKQTNKTTNEWAFIGAGTGGEPAPRAPEDLFDEDEEGMKTALQNKVDEIEAEDLDASDYPEENWQALQTALNIANGLLDMDEEQLEQSIVDKSLSNLELAYDELE